MAKRKPRPPPKTPEQIAEELAAKKEARARTEALRLRELRADSFAILGLQQEASDLDQNDDVIARAAGRKNVVSARRADAFDMLKAGMEPGAFDAARRLERDIRMRRGEHDHGRPLDRVDGDIASAVGRTDQILAAAERVNAVLKRLSPRDALLLVELIYPTAPRDYAQRDSAGREIGRITGWRAIVAIVTGETHAHAQGAAVRAACVNLRDAYDGLRRVAA